jgi:NADPH2:quinone reductase
MKAVGYKKSLPIDTADALIDFEAAKRNRRGAISASP